MEQSQPLDQIFDLEIVPLPVCPRCRHVTIRVLCYIHWQVSVVLRIYVHENHVCGVSGIALE